MAIHTVRTASGHKVLCKSWTAQGAMRKGGQWQAQPIDPNIKMLDDIAAKADAKTVVIRRRAGRPDVRVPRNR